MNICAGVALIGAGAFEGCAGLQQVTFAEGSALETIERRCFYGTGLNEVVLPAGVCEVGEEAFAECLMLKSVRFPEGSRLEIIG